MRGRRRRNHKELLAVRNAAIVFAPSHFTGISGEIAAGDMMVRPDFSAAKAREEAFGLVGASLVVRIGPFVVDALGDKASVRNGLN